MSRYSGGITDNDLYKFTMQQAICQHFPRDIVRYKFINRGPDNFPENFGRELAAEIIQFSMNRLSDEERKLMGEICSFLTPVYLDFLRGYAFNPDEVTISQTDKHLDITIEGPWYRTVLWEVPLMAMISEMYFEKTINTSSTSVFDSDKIAVLKAKKKKIDAVNEDTMTPFFAIADFGTRRRFSYLQHELVIDQLKDSLVGTSNVHFALRNTNEDYKLKAIGTHAHEWFMFHAAKYGYRSANQMSLSNWSDTFQGELGIALTDTYTTDVFYRDFGQYYSKLFDGVRQDSGDPIVFLNKTVLHYTKLGIPVESKTIVFSDGLDLDKAIKIHHAAGQFGIKCAFGIGTHLTNDIAGVTPLNMVIKLSEVLGNDGKWIPTVKLSDSPGKNTGEADAIQNCKEILGCEI